MHDRLRDTAREAARLAGEELVRLWHGPMHSRSKGLRDIVTRADGAAEQIIVETIRGRYPDHAILTEESGSLSAGDGTSDYRWIIDPLDGTTNYARHVPFFSVSIAVARAGRPVVGVVHDPLRHETYHALKGKGAYRGDERLSCSRRDRLIDFLIAIDLPRDEAHRLRLFHAISAMSPKIGGWRSFGSAALGLCYCAGGLADVYVHATLFPWDLSAGGLIAEEAGGRVTGLDGAAEWWDQGSCIASNGLMHEELLALFHGVVTSTR